MPHRILFVDDEPEVLSLLSRAFSPRDGYEALTASCGEDALELLARREVDLLVTDQRMSGMTGIELIAAARRGNPDLCAILLTAYTDPQELVAAINQGQVYRYLVKPWESADLRQTVVSALEHVHLKRDRARLHAELERRLAALQIASEIARDAGAVETAAALLERVVARVPEIVPCDAAAALLAPAGGAPVLLVRAAARLGDAALGAVRADALSALAEHAGGQPVDASALEVRLVGHAEGRGPEAFASRLTVPVHHDGAVAGVVVLESARIEAFTDGDARVLDVLVNELAEALRAFAARAGGERRRLERVIESLADGLVFAPQDGDAVVANPAARRMLGAPAAGALPRAWLEEALGFSPFALACDGDAAAPRALPVHEIRRGALALAPIVSQVPDGRGRPAGVAVVLRDVTEQRRLEERKEEFVHVVSHELRTPLTSITGALDLVLGGLVGALEPKQERYLKMARDSTDRLNALVDDILDVARLAKGKLRMELEPVRLDELVRAAVDRYHGAAAERGIELHVAVPAAPVAITADPGRLTQVLGNLLTNAVKFSPENGVVRVRVFRAAAASDLVAFTVWNGGDGLPEEDLERIFEKFEQSRASGRQARGSGLGLAICRGLVEAHGGRIWAESAPGEGVRLVVVLPDQPGAAAEKATRADGAAAVVVDEPDAAALARAVLEGRGFRCRTAPGPDEALALVRRLRPRLVVWDPALPALAGVPLADILRHDSDAREARLLATGDPGSRAAAVRAGAAGFVARPATAAELAAAAEAAVDRARASRGRVVVVDDDPAIRAICAEVLAGNGYDVVEAGSCAEARALVREVRPQALLVDVQLPDGDGFGLLEALADVRAQEPFAAVFLSARGEVQDKVRGLGLGADDYVTKPFDARELIARLDAALARREAALHASPMTRLPGAPAIDREVARRLQARVPFALTYVDLDHLKAFNDHYGYAKADGVLLQTAAILRDAVSAEGGDGAFLGHVGGDDFVIVTRAERAAPLCRVAIAAFDLVIPLYYDREDRERGYIDAADRYGARRRFPLLSVSAVTVIADPGRFAGHAELSRAAAELKGRAKRIPGSVHLVDGAVGGAAA
jgi:signal transduction histidine kinase/DNA-binding response OmpR family regulator